MLLIFFLNSLFSLVSEGGCQRDNQCKETEACIDNICQDPCQIPYPPCSLTALCTVTTHRPICRCPEGWAGDPHNQCFECMSITKTSVYKIFLKSPESWQDIAKQSNSCSKLGHFLQRFTRQAPTLITKFYDCKNCYFLTNCFILWIGNMSVSLEILKLQHFSSYLQIFISF